MENNNNTNQQLQMSPNQSTSLKIYNTEVTKFIGENIYLLGFNGSSELVIEISNKLTEIFGDIPISILEEIFYEFHSGAYKVSFNINISDISIALRRKGFKTIKERKSADSYANFYSFQQDLYKHNNQK